MTRFLSVALAGALLLGACGSSGTSITSASKQDSGLRFAQCMRSHGVSNFPDPTAGGQIQLGGSGISPFSPAFRAAQKSCQHLLPNKGQPGRMTAGERHAAVKFAECMRTHGVPNFPDPSDARPNRTNMALTLHGMSFAIGPGLSPDSPAFRQAAQRCGIKLPSGPPQSAPSR